MSRLCIDREGNLFEETIRRALYTPLYLRPIPLSRSQKEELEREVKHNGGRPVKAHKYLPRGYFKNQLREHSMA